MATVSLLMCAMLAAALLGEGTEAGWQQMDGRFVTSVSVGRAGVWAVNIHGYIYYRAGTYNNEVSPGTGWVPIKDSPRKLKQVSSGDDVVWGVHVDGRVFIRSGISSRSPTGTGWQKIRGSLKQVHASPTSRQLWGVDKKDRIWRRTGITEDNKAGIHWERIAGPDGGVGLKFVSVGQAGVWGVDRNGKVFYLKGTYGDETSDGTGWVRVDIHGGLTQITSGHGEVWGVNSNDQIFVRRGVSAVTPGGSGWERIGGHLRQVYISSSSNQVWGVQAGDLIYRRDGQHLPTPAGQATQQCGQRGPGSRRRRDANDGNRIIGGVDAGQDEFPWQVSLQYGGPNHICGGTLIGNQYVLTAAHCLSRTENPEPYSVRVGEWQLQSNHGTEMDIPVSEVHVHQGFNSEDYGDDIALLKLAQPASLGPACLPPAGTDYRGHQDCVLSGWGMVRRDPEEYANQLQKVTGTIWTQEDLYGQWGSALPSNAVGFGASAADGWGACMGDSGGPLVCPNGSGVYDVIGVVSFGSETCSDKPGVFTEVSAYRDWLNYKSGGDIPA